MENGLLRGLPRQLLRLACLARLAHLHITLDQSLECIGMHICKTTNIDVRDHVSEYQTFTVS